LSVARANFDGAALTDVEVIYQAKPLKDTNAHYGARMAWGGDGKLYVTTGEGFRYRERSQDPKTSFGAVVRLNEDGALRVPFGYVAGLHVDPVEKKPFFHVLPGAKALASERLTPLWRQQQR